METEFGQNKQYEKKCNISKSPNILIFVQLLINDY